MLVSICNADRRKSTYTCDRCKSKVITTGRISIYAGEGSGSPRKKWDLCTKCYKMLQIGIKRGGKTNENTNGGIQTSSRNIKKI